MGFSDQWDPFYAEYTITAWILIIIAYCCALCLIQHLICLPFFTCCKRENKFDKSICYEGDEFPIPLVSAHRGGGGERAENTLDAFKHAYAQGINFLELDLNITRDEQVVIFHDDELGRVCGPKYEGKTPSDYDYEDLPRLAKKIPTGMGSSDFYRMRDDESGKIPLLEDLFIWAEPLEKLGFSIDVKNGDDTLCTKLSDLVKKYKLESRVVWSSGFNSEKADLIAEKNEDVPTFYSLWSAVCILCCWCCGCVSCWPLSADFYQIPYLSNLMVRGADIGSSCLGPCFLKLGRCLISSLGGLTSHLRARGNMVTIWTLN